MKQTIANDWLTRIAPAYVSVTLPAIGIRMSLHKPKNGESRIATRSSPSNRWRQNKNCVEKELETEHNSEQTHKYTISPSYYCRTKCVVLSVLTRSEEVMCMANVHKDSAGHWKWFNVFTASNWLFFFSTENNHKPNKLHRLHMHAWVHVCETLWVCACVKESVSVGSRIIFSHILMELAENICNFFSLVNWF